MAALVWSAKMRAKSESHCFMDCINCLCNGSRFLSMNTAVTSIRNRTFQSVDLLQLLQNLAEHDSNCQAASVSERNEAIDHCLFELQRYIYSTSYKILG